MRLISLPMLTPDMILARSIYYRECLVLREGQKDLGRFINSLKNLGIEHVYVEDAKSNGIEIPDAVSEETRVNCKRVLRNVLEEFQTNSTINVTLISETIRNVVEEVLNNPDVQVSLNDIGAVDEYTYTHSVSTTVYALLIAKQLDYSRQSLEKLAIGTLLHDIGKVYINKELLFKDTSLNNGEYELMKQHTVLGYQQLKQCVHLTELSRIIALYHHERMDGTGYPTGIQAGELHEFARIVAIADVYDALTTDRTYKKRWNAQKAVNYLVRYSGTKFDTALVAIFIQQIAIYPNGSMVHLSNGTIGIVKEQNNSVPLRPIVRVIANDQGKEIDLYEIDLLKELSITILETEIEIDLETKEEIEDEDIVNM